MSFADDDLARLKAYIEDEDYINVTVSSDGLTGLIKRLEAAEALQSYWKYYAPVSQEDEKEYNAKVEAWRKAAGR